MADLVLNKLKFHVQQIENYNILPDKSRAISRKPEKPEKNKRNVKIRSI